MCHFETSWEDESLYFPELPMVLSHLEEMKNDKLIEIKDAKLIVTEKGKPFVRNICMAFDLRLLADKPKTPVFSMVV